MSFGPATRASLPSTNYIHIHSQEPHGTRCPGVLLPAAMDTGEVPEMLQRARRFDRAGVPLATASEPAVAR